MSNSCLPSGLNGRATRFPYLYVQFWDMDVLKYNDFIAEGVIDIGRCDRQDYAAPSHLCESFRVYALCM
jgi:hypothetical protein